jgi:predicted DNA-binding protein (MmcQ/YjbR family)
MYSLFLLTMDLAELRDICLALLGVTEDIKWEHHLCFNVGKKMFVITSPDEVPVNVSLKVSEEDFSKLVTKKGVSPASHLARYHWINVSDIGLFSRKDWKHFATEAHRLVASKLAKSEKKKIGII